MLLLAVLLSLLRYSLSLARPLRSLALFILVRLLLLLGGLKNAKSLVGITLQLVESSEGLAGGIVKLVLLDSFLEASLGLRTQAGAALALRCLRHL